VRPTVSPDQVVTGIRTVLPDAELEAAPSCEGMESQVFAVKAQDRDWVVRVNPSSRGFVKDLYAATHFASDAVPIPGVLRIGKLEEGFAFCISECLPGVTLQDTAVPVLEGLARAVDDVVAAIHQTNVGATVGLGLSDERGSGTFASWRSWLLDALAHDAEAWGLADEKFGPELNAAREHFAGLAERCPEYRRLIHGDWGSNNVLTNGETITGVLDWADFGYGDPLFDVAGCFFWRSWLECMEVQARYYEERLRVNGDHVVDRIRCYQLRVGLCEICQAVREENWEFGDWAFCRTREILRGL
jgi:hygromycin-B 4-O-kinase